MDVFSIPEIIFRKNFQKILQEENDYSVLNITLKVELFSTCKT